LESARDDLNKLLEKKDQQGISWVLGDSGKKYFTVPTPVKPLRNHFGLDLTLRPKRVEDIENYVHVEYGLYFRDSISDKYIELSCGSSRKPKNLKAGDIVGTNTIECAETAAIGRCLKFFFGVNSDLANDEEIKYSKGLSNNLTVIETLEKRRNNKNAPIKHNSN
jgi:hypothetical protein